MKTATAAVRQNKIAQMEVIREIIRKGSTKAQIIVGRTPKERRWMRFQRASKWKSVSCSWLCLLQRNMQQHWKESLQVLELTWSTFRVEFGELDSGASCVESGGSAACCVEFGGSAACCVEFGGSAACCVKFGDSCASWCCVLNPDSALVIHVASTMSSKQNKGSRIMLAIVGIGTRGLQLRGA